MQIIDGWLQGACRQISANADDRPAGEIVDLLVIHNISLPPGCYGGDNISDFFCNRLNVEGHAYFAEIAHLKVSAHLLIARSGDVTQFVSLDRRAWHAGVSQMSGRERCNDFSIGIELEGTDIDPYTAMQSSVLISLTRAIMSAYPAITPERIVGHSDIAPGRKSDPGDSFDWHAYLCGLQAVNL